jgi:hypothetical protein
MDSRLVDKFWAGIGMGAKQPHMETPCWLWTKGAITSGYGVIAQGPRGAVEYFYTHRLSYELHRGQILPGLKVDHRCHVPRCVRPDHLRMTTHKQNLENRKGPQRNSKSGVRGVFWDKRRQSWRASIKHHGVIIYIGNFTDLDEASRAVQERRNELFTHNDLDRL